MIHGLEVFLPLIRRHGGEGHIVNTASIAGFQIGGHRRSGSYGAMKFAVVALSESIAYDLKDSPIGVSVLAPAAVKTRIYTSGENRPERFGGPYREPGNNAFQSELDEGLEPDVVGERVVRAIRHNEFYVFTHMHTKDWLLARHQRIIAAFDECEQWIAERTMKFSYFHLMPWTDLEEAPAQWPASNAAFVPERGKELYDNYIATMAFAEQCGFDWVGCNEHHFSPYGLMANCNLIGAALSQRTSNDQARDARQSHSAAQSGARGGRIRHARRDERRAAGRRHDPRRAARIHRLQHRAG